MQQVPLEAVPLDLVAASIRGASQLEERDDGFAPLHLPTWTRARQADRWIELWSAHTVGVRFVVRTAARHLRLEVTVTRMVPADAEAPPFPASVVAEIDGREVARATVEAGPLVMTLPDRTWREEDGPRVILDLVLPESDGEREVTVWLPHNGACVIHSLQADAAVRAAAVPAAPRWLHHGSSVSHGLEAASPRQTWPQLAAAALGLELDNLAIAGNAQLDGFVARTLAELPADIITLKLGVNSINADSMRRRAFVPALHEFLDVVREGHPGTPIVVLTPIVSPAIESVPGPTRKVGGVWIGSPRETLPGDGTLTLGIVRELVEAAVRQRMATDDRLWFADGLELLGMADRSRLWDDLHPDQQGYDLMAERFVARARDTSTPLGAAFALVR